MFTDDQVNTSQLRISYNPTEKGNVYPFIPKAPTTSVERNPALTGSIEHFSGEHLAACKDRYTPSFSFVTGGGTLEALFGRLEEDKRFEVIEPVSEIVRQNTISLSPDLKTIYGIILTPADLHLGKESPLATLLYSGRLAWWSERYGRGFNLKLLSTGAALDVCPSCLIKPVPCLWIATNPLRNKEGIPHLLCLIRNAETGTYELRAKRVSMEDTLHPAERILYGLE